MWGKGRVIFGKDIGKYQARKSGNIKRRNRETSGKEIGKHQAKNRGTSVRRENWAWVEQWLGSSPGKSTSSGSYLLPAEELSVPRMKIFLGSR